MQQTVIHIKQSIRALLLIGSIAALNCVAEESESAAEGAVATAKETLSCLLASNCVNSLDDLSSLPPLRFSGSAEDGKTILMRTLAAFPEARIVANDPLQVEAVFTTTLGFRDQVLFRIDASGQRIDFRSSSNFGLYDFGKNRSRMKDFTARFDKESGR